MAKFKARIQAAPDSPAISITAIVSDELAALPSEEANKHLATLLQHVRPKPEFVIHGFTTVASYENPIPRESLLGHNTLVEVSIPYTLHLPNNTQFSVVCPGPGRATVVPRKIWTDLARGSSDVEVYAEDQLLYYGPTTQRTHNMPQAPELGPWPRLTGTNLEISKDTHGVFRYTRMTVMFDSVLVGVDGPDDDERVSEAQSAAFEQAQATAKDIVNYVLDVYRYVTGAEHVERLPSITANRVYFADHNLLSESITIQSGSGSAIINRSGREIRKIEQMLKSGEEPPRHVLLIQSARAALSRGQIVLAVVVSFQALEILLETKLRVGYAKMGLSELEIARKLRKHYKTADRLNLLCREATGKSVADDTTFWTSWLADCNRRRNSVVHRNEVLTDSQALRVVELCEDCITRLLALQFPP
jgi:hypothetical protein